MGQIRTSTSRFERESPQPFPALVRNERNLVSEGLFMKLISAQIMNFRSAEDSEAFKVEQVTCLVGKNEAGKSAILLALAALNPHPSTPVVFDRERDYPRRHLTAYAQRHKGQEAVAIQTKWKLTDEKMGDV